MFSFSATDWLWTLTDRIWPMPQRLKIYPITCFNSEPFSSFVFESFVWLRQVAAWGSTHPNECGCLSRSLGGVLFLLHFERFTQLWWTTFPIMLWCSSCCDVAQACNFASQCVNVARCHDFVQGLRCFFNLCRLQFQTTSEAISQRIATRVAQWAG